MPSSSSLGFAKYRLGVTQAESPEQAETEGDRIEGNGSIL